MSIGVIAYLLGMGLLFVGERLLAGTPTLRWIVVAVGALTVVGSAVARGLRMRDAEDAGIEKGHRTALALTVVGVGALLLFVLSTEAATEFLGFTGEASSRWQGVWGAIWPVVWLCGSLPLVVVDRALQTSPIVAPPRQIRESLQYGLSAALGIALVFPVNFLASQHGTAWNLSYFETAEAGSSTTAMVESLDEPIHVYAFYPPNSEVAGELERYFAPLEGPTLTFRRVDQTARPRLARKLEVRENGRIAFTNRRFDGDSSGADGKTDGDEGNSKGDDGGDGRVVETLEIPTKLDDAESKLEQLDRHVKQRLTAVSQGERVAYVTTGHGEFKAERDANRKRRLIGFEKVLEATGFRVETLGLGDGLGGGVPQDADLVAIMGPTDSFLASEVDALRNYLDRGGSLLVAVEPKYARRDRTTLAKDDPLRELFDRFGIRMGGGVLAAESSIVPVANNKTDRLNIVTDSFSSHPSTATLSDAKLVLFTPSAGFLRARKLKGPDRTLTVRSRPNVWVDRNGNLQFDEKAGEKKKSRPIVAALRGSSGGGGPDWRAIVSADATAFSDFALGNRGNQQFVYDTAHWLVGTPQFSGSVESEEDVRIRHTKEGQAVWFYGTVVAVPLLLLAAGGLRIWSRRKGGES